MICPRCQNSDERYFYQREGKWYCRKCIAYERKEDISIVPVKDKHVEIHLDYSLTPTQQEVSHALLERYKNHQNTLLKAVCGAGKTEMIYEVIAYALNHRQRVCLTVPRKELVKELAERIEQHFTGIELTILYGGCAKSTTGDFVICTTHQLYRFDNYFDLLILDEMDAFPYAFDEVLHQFLQATIKGNTIYMSATIEKGDLNIYERFHRQPIPVPRFVRAGKILAALLIVLRILRYKKENKPVFLFVASIQETKRMCQLLSFFKIRACRASSQEKDIHTHMHLLKTHQIDVIVTTTVLERGVTLENIQVLVYQGEHRIFTHATLIQIAGRAGRKMGYHSGDVYIYASRKTKEITQCIKQLQQDNALSALQTCTHKAI